MHNLFTEKVNKIALSANDYKRIQSIDSKETYTYGTSKDLVSEKEEIKINNIIKNTKITNFDDVTKENIKEHDSNLPQIPDYPHRISIIGGSRLGKTNALLNLINHKLYSDKIDFLYAKGPYEGKYQFLIN